MTVRDPKAAGETNAIPAAIATALAAAHYRDAVTACDHALASAPRTARGRLHYLRLVAIERGALGDVDVRSKDALAACTSPSDAIDVRLALGRVALARGEFDTALRFGTAMTPLLASADTSRRAAAISLEAAAKMSQGALAEAVTLYGSAVSVLKDSSDALAMAEALNSRGLARGYTSDLKGALADHEAAMAALVSVPESNEAQRTRALVHNAVGFALWNLGRLNDALDALTMALTLYCELGDLGGEGVTANNIGNVHRHCGRAREAHEAYTRAVTLCRQSGNRLYEAIGLNNLGQLAADGDHLAEAEALFTEALALTRALGDRIREADNLGSLGLLALSQGDPAAAVQHLSQAVALRRRLRDHAYLVLDLSALAVAEMRAGDADTAREHLEECEESLRAGQQGVEQLQRVHLHAHLVHQALGESALAQAALVSAVEALREQLQQVTSPEARAAMIDNVAANREIRALAEAAGISLNA